MKRTIDLAGRYLTEWPVITNPQTVTDLDISDNNFTAVPSSISLFTHLSSLNLSRNDLSYLPDEIGLLSYLTTLDVSTNSLTELPSTLGQLTSLVLLDVTQNELTALPSSMSSLTKLSKLYADHNRIHSLSLSLPSLVVLTASHNELDDLSDDIIKCSMLESLYVDNNHLSHLPLIPTLAYLNIEHNEFTTLDNIGQMTNLVGLSISHNSLEELPAGLTSLPQLQWLNVDDYLLDDITDPRVLLTVGYLNGRNHLDLTITRWSKYHY